MSRALGIFCLFAIAAAAVFVRLGLWQVERLRERRATNAAIVSQQRKSARSLSDLVREGGDVRFRAARVDGAFDYDRELVIANRTRRGSPGVEMLTPVRIAGSDTAVMVNRGWVYSPDAASVDRVRWREGEEARLTGYAERFTESVPGDSAANPRTLRRLALADVRSRVPYPVHAYYLIATGDTTDLAHPARRDFPTLGDGSHRSYAFQWFSFATIALVGAVVVVVRERRARRSVSV